jgi:hypothetical protein
MNHFCSPRAVPAFVVAQAIEVSRTVAGLDALAGATRWTVSSISQAHHVRSKWV